MLSVQLKNGEYLTIGENIVVQVYQTGQGFRVACGEILLVFHPKAGKLFAVGGEGQGAQGGGIFGGIIHGRVHPFLAGIRIFVLTFWIIREKEPKVKT